MNSKRFNAQRRMGTGAPKAAVRTSPAAETSLSVPDPRQAIL
jgi:hypothetical protein